MELPVIVYACECFYMYLCSNPFTVETEHKPIEMVALRNLTHPHLQRMLLLLQEYDGTIKYMPGTKMQLQDALSKLSNIRQRDEIPLDLWVDHIAFSDTNLAQVCKETKSCQLLSTVYRLTHN